MPAFRDIAYTAYALRDTPLAVPVPAGVEDGDTLLALIVLRVTETLDTIAGWELVDGYPVLVEQQGGGFQLNAYLLRRVANSEPESYDFTWDGTGGGTAQSCGVIYAASGAVDSIAFGLPLTNSAFDTDAITADAIDVDPDTLVVWFGVNWQLYGGAQTVPSGTTPTFTQRLKASDSLQYVADGVFSAGGDTADRSQAGSNTGTLTDGWFGVMAGLQPPAEPETHDIIGAGGILSDEAFGLPTVTPVEAPAPSPAPSPAAAHMGGGPFRPALRPRRPRLRLPEPAAVAPHSLELRSIPTEEAFGRPRISVTLSPASIVSVQAHQLGRPRLRYTPTMLQQIDQMLWLRGRRG